MATKWDWLEKAPATWGFALRVVVKAAIWFALCNVIYAALDPLEALGHVSLYNTLLPGRERLPYGENPDQSYSLSLNNIPAMFASHVISRPKAEGEFRVVLIGDSGVWGWFLKNEDTLAGVMNQFLNTTSSPSPLSASSEGEQNTRVQAVGARRAVPLQSTQNSTTIYNLAYPIMSLTKDLMLLDEAMSYQPDMIVWLVTLESFPREKQLFPPLVQHNAGRARQLVSKLQTPPPNPLPVNGEGGNTKLDTAGEFSNDMVDDAVGELLNPTPQPPRGAKTPGRKEENRYTNSIIDPNDPRLIEPDFWGRTIVGQRRDLADLLRLQLYGFSWAATGIDQYIPDEIPLRQSDFEADESWQNFDMPTTLTADDLAFDVLAAGIERAEDVPVLIVNEPIFISDGANSDLRYNSWYPRWAYDQYRDLLAEEARASGWHYVDLWDSIDAAEFTDSPVHLTAAGTARLAEIIRAAVS